MKVYRVVAKPTYSGSTRYSIQLKKPFLFWHYWSEKDFEYGYDSAMDTYNRFVRAAESDVREYKQTHGVIACSDPKSKPKSLVKQMPE